MSGKKLRLADGSEVKLHAAGGPMRSAGLFEPIVFPCNAECSGCGEFFDEDNGYCAACCPKHVHDECTEEAQQ